MRPVPDARRRLADDCARQRRYQRALRADADARVSPATTVRAIGFAGNSSLSPHIEAMLAAAQEARLSASTAGLATPGGHVGVSRLVLTDFRNYRSARLDLDPGPVVLTGPDGAGKTNLLAALSFPSPAPGLRNARLGRIGRRDAS